VILQFAISKTIPRPVHFPSSTEHEGVGERVGVGDKVTVGVSVKVGVVVNVGVRVGVDVGLGLGVIVGPRNWPGLQAENKALTMKTAAMTIPLYFFFMIAPIYIFLLLEL
jgi:hypothetical protein